MWCNEQSLTGGKVTTKESLPTFMERPKSLLIDHSCTLALSRPRRKLYIHVPTVPLRVKSFEASISTGKRYAKLGDSSSFMEPS